MDKEYTKNPHSIFKGYPEAEKFDGEWSTYKVPTERLFERREEYFKMIPRENPFGPLTGSSKEVSYKVISEKALTLGKEKNFLGAISMEKHLGLSEIDFFFYGSSPIVGLKEAGDIDVLILVKDPEDCRTLVRDYNLERSTSPESLSSRTLESSSMGFVSYRLGELNVMFTQSPDMYEKTRRAQDICESLGLDVKEDRIKVFDKVLENVGLSDEDFVKVITKEKSLKDFRHKGYDLEGPPF